MVANFPGLELKHGRAGGRGRGGGGGRRGRRSGQGGHTRVISCWDATVAAGVAAVALGLQQVLVEGSLQAAGHIAKPVGHSRDMAAKQRLMAARSIVASQCCIANEDTIGSRIGSSSISCLVARHHGLVGSPRVS